MPLCENVCRFRHHIKYLDHLLVIKCELSSFITFHFGSSYYIFLDTRIRSNNDCTKDHIHKAILHPLYVLYFPFRSILGTNMVIMLLVFCWKSFITPGHTYLQFSPHCMLFIFQVLCGQFL